MSTRAAERERDEREERDPESQFPCRAQSLEI